MIIFSSLLGIAALLYSLFFFFQREKMQDRIFFAAGLSIKLLCGLALGGVYKYYYDTGDTFLLYNEASVLSNLLFTNPAEYFSIVFVETSSALIPVFDEQPRALLFVKILSIINVFSFDSYWITSAYLSSFSFLCAWYYIKKVKKLMPEFSMEAMIVFLFLPSFVFWSSGIIKESVAMMSLLCLSGFILAILRNASVKMGEWGLAALSVFLSWQLKYYWAALFFICAGACLVVTKMVLAKWPHASRVALISCWAGVIIIASLGMSLLRPNFNLDRFLNVVVENHDAFVALSSPTDVIHYYDLKPTWGSVLLNSPAALVAGLFRPYFFEASTLFQAAASMENLFILLLTLISVYQLRRSKLSPYYIIGFSLLAYCLLLSIFLSLSTPNFGTLSRYRTGFLPFFVFLVFCQSKVLQKIGVKSAVQL